MIPVEQELALLKRLTRGRTDHEVAFGIAVRREVLEARTRSWSGECLRSHHAGDGEGECSGWRALEVRCRCRCHKVYPETT